MKQTTILLTALLLWLAPGAAYAQKLWPGCDEPYSGAPQDAQGYTCGEIHESATALTAYVYELKTQEAQGRDINSFDYDAAKERSIRAAADYRAGNGQYQSEQWMGRVADRQTYNQEMQRRADRRPGGTER